MSAFGMARVSSGRTTQARPFGLLRWTLRTSRLALKSAIESAVSCVAASQNQPLPELIFLKCFRTLSLADSLAFQTHSHPFHSQLLTPTSAGILLAKGRCSECPGSWPFSQRSESAISRQVLRRWRCSRMNPTKGSSLLWKAWPPPVRVRCCIGTSLMAFEMSA